MLECNHTTICFGGLTAVNDLNLCVKDGEIVGLIGPNGAGKTTAFNMITGVYKPTSGNITWDGTDITKLKPHQITKLGLARTFQNIRLFSEMNVLENVMVAENLRANFNLFESVLHLPGYCRRERFAKEDALSLLHQVGLEEHAYDSATSLPYGEQRYTSADGGFIVDALVGTRLLTQFIERLTHLVIASVCLDVGNGKTGYLSHLVIVLLLGHFSVHTLLDLAVCKFGHVLGCCLLGLSLGHGTALAHPLQKLRFLKVDKLAVRTIEGKFVLMGHLVETAL